MALKKKKSDYAIEKSDKHYFNQVVKINLKSDTRLYCVLLIGCDKNDTCLCSFYPKHNLTSGLPWEKTSAQLQLRVVLKKYLTSTPQNCRGHS